LAWILFRKSSTGESGLVTVEVLDTERSLLDEAYFAATKLKIEHAIEDGYAPADIALLTRKKDKGSLLAQYLLANGIKVVSSESLLLNASPEVQFIVHLLQLAVAPNNQLSQAAVMRYLAQHQLELDFNLCMERWSEWANEEQKSRYIKISEFLKDNNYKYNRYRVVQQPLYQSVEEIIRSFRLNKQPNAFLQFFLDAVQGFSTKKGNNLNDFLDWWEVKKHSLSVLIPDGIDAVRILTIHKSKGLQFPVVIVPFVNWQLSEHAREKAVWLELNDEVDGLPVGLVPIKKDLGNTAYAEQYTEEKNKSFLDDLNLLYVAFTRAEERLHVFTDNYQRSIGEHVSEAIPTMEHFQIAEQRLRMGMRAPKLPEKKKRPSLFAMEYFLSAPWNDKLTISFQAPQLWHESGLEARNYEQLLANIFTHLPSLNELPDALNALVTDGLVAEEEMLVIEALADELLSRNNLQPFYANPTHLLRSAELISADGNSVRPGRILLQAPKATVVRFLPGEERTITSDDMLQSEQLLGEMGYSAITLYHYFLSSGELNLFTPLAY